MYPASCVPRVGNSQLDVGFVFGVDVIKEIYDVPPRSEVNLTSLES